MVGFDKLLLQIGEFGWYQKTRCILLIIMGSFVCGYVHFSGLFMLFQPPYGCTDDTTALSYNFTCTKKCVNYTYDTTMLGWTFLSEYDLVCDRKWIVAVVLNSYVIGDIFGTMFIGMLTDYFGRKVLFFGLLTIYLGAGVIAFCVPGVSAFAVGRFFHGMCSGSSYRVILSWMLEFVEQSKSRTLLINMYIMGFALVAVSVAPMAYMFKNWQHLGWLTTFPLALLYLSWWMTDESPRWLMSMSKHDQATRIIKKIAKSNKRSLSEDLFESIEFQETSTLAEVEQKEGIQPKLSFFREVAALLTESNLRNKLIVISVVMMVNSLIYHTFHYNIENLPVNPYVTFATMALLEAPASIFNSWWAEFAGRVHSSTILLVIGGTASLATTLVARDATLAIGVLAGITKFCISCTFTTVYQIGAESYPTDVRSSGLGFCALTGIVVNLLMPLVLASAEHMKLLPMIIFSCLMFLAAAITMLMPETKGTTLPDDLQQTKAIGSVGFHTFKLNCRLGRLIKQNN